MKFSRTMLNCAVALPVLGVAGLSLWLNSHREVKAEPVAQVETKKSDVAVISPPSDQVGCVEQLTCQVAKGWPVILVRDANERSPWWVQAPAESEGANKFKTRVHFGNEKTESGQKYQIVVLATPDASQAQLFETGTTMNDLPEDVPHSEPVIVVRR
ncbi:MAG: hypothetical protein NT013_15855 [Planctomycetia bacterium]|nr:hypothetical protein [Planctomycetia bacterium]